MDPGLSTAIGALAAFGGGTISGLIALKLAKQSAAEHEQSELRAALVGFGSALDLLKIEIDQLPLTPSRSSLWIERALDRLPTLGYFFGWLARLLIGAPMDNATEQFIAASNRLLLVAPESLLEPLRRANELLGRINQRDESWYQEWDAVRGDLFRIARDELGASDPRGHLG